MQSAIRGLFTGSALIAYRKTWTAAFQAPPEPRARATRVLCNEEICEGGEKGLHAARKALLPTLGFTGVGFRNRTDGGDERSLFRFSGTALLFL